MNAVDFPSLGQAEALRQLSVTPSFLQATPWDNLGALLPVKELIGLMSFSFDLVIPGAETIWSQTIERSDEDIADLLYATPYQYTMRHRFPKPPGV